MWIIIGVVILVVLLSIPAAGYRIALGILFALFAVGGVFTIFSAPLQGILGIIIFGPLAYALLTWNKK